MSEVLTVAQLISILSQMDPSSPVVAKPSDALSHPVVEVSTHPDDDAVVVLHLSPDTTSL